MEPANILILPGLDNSGPGHWQTLWEARHGYVRVEQHDWARPLRGDWLARLEEVVLSCDEPPVLVAHSLGCQLVSAWAARSRHARRVKAALLVAAADTERPEFRVRIPTWSPIDLQALPFTAVLLASRTDPTCDIRRAQLFAHAWGAQFMDYGDCGHMNADAGLASWPEGHVLLQDLVNE